MSKFFNTAFSLSMVSSPCMMQVVELSEAEAADWLRANDVKNVANPSHANTLAAVSQRLGVDVRGAAGGRVMLTSGDQCLVAQVSFPASVPRETTEYANEQLALGKFSFQLVTVTLGFTRDELAEILNDLKLANEGYSLAPVSRELRKLTEAIGNLMN